MPPPPVTLTFDLLTLKVVSESRVTWATFVLSILDLGPMYATDVRQIDVKEHHRLMPPPRGRGHNKRADVLYNCVYQKRPLGSRF